MDNENNNIIAALQVYTMTNSYMLRTYLFAVLTVVAVLFNQHLTSADGKTLQAIEELYIPLETCDVSQFAFAAFSRVAAGHKVNSSWGEGACNEKQTKPGKVKIHISFTFSCNKPC